jgi:hypothetical protein
MGINQTEEIDTLDCDGSPSTVLVGANSKSDTVHINNEYLSVFELQSVFKWFIDRGIIDCDDFK